jgi:hypothetical protein
VYSFISSAIISTLGRARSLHTIGAQDPDFEPKQLRSISPRMQRALRCPFLANTMLNTTVPYVQIVIYVIDEIQDKRCFICCSASERRKGWNISLILELHATHDITTRWHFKVTVSEIQLISAPQDLERWRDELMALDDLQRVQGLAAWLDQIIF